MPITPHGSFVLLKNHEEPNTGSIILASTVKTQLHLGKVVAVGPGTEEMPMEALVNDIVYYQPLDKEHTVTEGGEEYLFVHSSRIFGKRTS